jgi:hypothetical protein
MLLLCGVISGRLFAQGNGAANSTAPAGAAAVKFNEDPVDEDQKKNLTAIGPILVAGKFDNPQQQNDFDTFYKTYALPRWTQLDTLGDLRNYRKELVNNLYQAKSGEVHDHLSDMVLDYMSKLAKGNYHPAVRYNAMLMIGDLNAVEGYSSTPLTKTLPILLSALNDDNQIEPVKVAALIGILRHVSAGVNDAQIKNQIFTAMSRLAGEDDGGEAGRQWMRMQAMEILGLLGMPGNDNQVADALSRIVANAEAPSFMRCAAAETLGKLKYASGNGLNLVDLAKGLGQLMLKACQEELQSVKETNNPVSRRRLKARLDPAIEGLKGVLPLAKEPEKKYLEDLQTIFDELDRDLNKEPPKLKEDDPQKHDEEMQDYNDALKKSVQGCQTKLEAWLGKKI